MINSNMPLVLHDIEGEPRVYDLDLAKRLNFERPLSIRDLIKRNRERLETFGVLRTMRKTSGAHGGRPTEEFYLNQKQSVFICMRSETDKAFDVQVEVVEVFVAWRTGTLKIPDFSNPAEAARAWALEYERAEAEKLERLKTEEQLGVTQQALGATQEELGAAKGKIDTLAPKADYTDRLLGSYQTVDMEEAAKLLRTSRHRLMTFLKDRGFLNRNNLPKQRFIDKDLARVHQTPYQDIWGREQVSLKTVLTQQGLAYVRAMLDGFGVHDKSSATKH